MKVFLLHPDRDVDLDADVPMQHEALTEDLGLGVVWNVMAAGDRYLWDVAREVVLTSLTEADEVRYRQQVFADCLASRDVVRQLYDVAVDALEAKRKTYSFWSTNSSPSALLSSGVKTLQMLLGNLRQLRAIADEHADRFGSEGFDRFFSMIGAELDDAYLEEVAAHLKELPFRSGQLVSARLGKGNKASYTLQRTPARRLLGGTSPPGRSAKFRVETDNDPMLQALGELREQGINLVANAVAQSGDHVMAFFARLRYELAFYLGCVNLVERLTAKGEPVCVPEPLPLGKTDVTAQGLYDVGLSLRLAARAVGNDLAADTKHLIMITGANQGGKSTLLRAIGLAQLMMQAGMPVAAERYRADVRAGVFTHFKREEDPTLTSGKFDEELVRMRDLVSVLPPNALVLCNESFASTNEQEGSEIAREVVRALTEAGMKVVFVTHLFDLADSLYRNRDWSMLFLRAERRADGRRTFRVIEGEPLATSYGRDSYDRIFGCGTSPTPHDVGVTP